MSASRVTLSGMHEFHLVLDFALNPFNQASSLVAQTVKNLPANAGDPGLDPPGRDSPLEEGMETHCSTLAWRFPQTEEPDGLLSMGSQRAGQD